jgi:hypothetical protein
MTDLAGRGCLPYAHKIQRGLGAVVLGALLAGCAGPSFTYADYEQKAVQTADDADSAVQTARLAARVAVERKATGQYLDVLFTDVETQVGDVEDVFNSVQPPDGRADGLRQELGDLLGETSDVLARLRIEVRRGNLGDLAEVARPLADLHEKLDQFVTEHR